MYSYSIDYVWICKAYSALIILLFMCNYTHKIFVYDRQLSYYCVAIHTNAWQLQQKRRLSRMLNPSLPGTSFDQANAGILNKSDFTWRSCACWSKTWRQSSITCQLMRITFWLNTICVKTTSLTRTSGTPIAADEFMRYIPSPIPLQFSYLFSATANASGRMQYHKIKPGHSKLRISRQEFIKAYNDSQILAINPLQLKGQDAIFQFEFYL